MAGRVMGGCLLVLTLLALAGCEQRALPEESSPVKDHATDPALNEVADSYVRLVLAVGRHDGNYVDAYYGPADWKEAAESGDPVPVPELLAQARELLARVRKADPSPRRAYLVKQLTAVEGFLRRLSGESMTLSEEARLLYDIDPPVKTKESFEAARARVEALVPGEGDLPDRVTAFRDQFVIPQDRLEAVVDAILDEARRRTAQHVALPDGERFETSYVTDQPWSAYNWYKGDLHSLIEVNTDLPIEIGRLIVTMPHESYPGHHTYNSLLEHHVARERGWREITVYPLYSPQSLIAEGTANAGVNVIMSRDERLAFMRDTLAPIAGLEGRDFESYMELLEALEPFKYARGEAARMLLGEGADEEEVVRFLVRYGLMSDERARKGIDFIRTYRAYVFNYTAGEDLVFEHIGDGPDRADRYFDPLKRTVTPSGLAGLAEG